MSRNRIDRSSLSPCGKSYGLSPEYTSAMTTAHVQSRVALAIKIVDELGRRDGALEESNHGIRIEQVPRHDDLNRASLRLVDSLSKARISRTQAEIFSGVSHSG